jgi:hypothetical protein
MKNFSSVSTNAARFQDISLNPQKLAGMCAKLKCCLNYEVDDYIEASRKLPSKEVVLETKDADYYFFKSDILAGMVTYSTDKRLAANLETITGQRALQIVEMNKHGEKPLTLSEDGNQQDNGKPVDMFEGDVTRFDKSRKKKKNKGQRQQARAQHGQGGGERKQKGGSRENRDGQQRPQRRNGEPKPNSES